MRRRAFTLVELLVVIGIIAVMVSIIMPALAKARQQAKLTVCSNNLRQVVAATIMYQIEHKGDYPCPCYQTFHAGRFTGAPGAEVPSDLLLVTVINQLAPYLGYKEIRDIANPLVNGTNFNDHYLFPRVLCTPSVWENGLIGDSKSYFAMGWLSAYQTGYDYFGRIDETVLTTGPWPAELSYPGHRLGQVDPVTGVENRERIATKGHNGVLWADDVVFYCATVGGAADTVYSHGYGDNRDNTTTPWPGSFSTLLGQHCGWSDGSVEWRSAGYMNIDLSNAPTSLLKSAGYAQQDAGAGGYNYIFWF